MTRTVTVPLIVLGFLSLMIWIKYRIAKWHVMSRRVREAAVFQNLIHVVAWDPKEALVLIKQLAISPAYVNRKNGVARRGGVKIIYPVLGQSVYARINLGRKETMVELCNLLSLDKVRVTVNATIIWQVQDVDKVVEEFNILVCDDPASQGQEIIDNAGYFLNLHSTKIIRGLIAANKITLPALIMIRESSRQAAEDGKTTDIRDGFYNNFGPEDDFGITLRIKLSALAERYGIGIDMVNLQIGFPEGIHQAIEEVWQSTIQPVANVYQSLSKEIDFRSTEKLIGSEAATIRELLRSIPGTALFGKVPLLDEYLDRLYSKRSMNGNGDTGIKILKRGDASEEDE